MNALKVLFINMPIRFSARPNNVPIGIGILSSLVKQLGHECYVLDLNVYRPVIGLEQVKEKIISYEEDFDLIALSGMITTLRWQKKIARLARELFPRACLITGGGLASDFGNVLFDWIPELDAAVVGEGELILPQILTDLQRIRKSRKIFGPVITPDLNLIPGVDWDQFKMEVYLKNPVWGSEAKNSSWMPFTPTRSINFISSRGCPYNCYFCDRHTTGGRNYRVVSSERLIKDIYDVIEKFQVDFIGFTDDNFITDKKRLQEFLPLIKESGLLWGCHGRLNEVDEELAEQLREAGCVYIGFGGESADENVLKRMNKKNSPAQMSRAIKACQKAGITPNCTWIMGYPGETRDSLRRTANFILEHGLNQKSMFVATAYPGTVFFEEVKNKILSIYNSLEEYVLDLDDATKLLIHNGKVLNYSDMSDEEFLECRKYVETGELEKI
jgi:radical SAM superfamily enzyme YgiQ (UPF0313 family)